MTRLGRTFALTLMIALATPFGAFAAEPCPPEPHPCGDEWPAGLEETFALKEARPVQVASHDGVILNGWISFPNLPAGVRAPAMPATLSSMRSSYACFLARPAPMLRP